MFRKARRKNKEISLEASKDLLRLSRRGVLSVNGDNGYPYAIPINYLYDEKNNRIIFHSSKVGHKVDSLKKSDKVCFTVFGNETIKEEKWAPFLQSVVVFGRCRFVEEKEETLRLVKQFALKYYPNEEMVNEEISLLGMNVQIFIIDIEHLSGKEIQEK